MSYIFFFETFPRKAGNVPRRNIEKVNYNSIPASLHSKDKY